MASNAWSTADMTDSLTDTTIQADIPRRSNYQPPSVSEHIAEDDGPFATLPLDSPILLEEVKTGPNPVGERLVAGVPRIIIRDNRDGHLTSPPITGDNPPPVEVPPGSPPLTSEIPILTPTEDSFPDSETGSDVNEGENEDEGYTSSESDEGGNEKVGSTTREGHSGKERMSLEVRCYYCDERFKFRGEGPAELLLCKHWVCHGCLLASFGLSLLDAEYVPRCRCGGDVSLQVFRTVFAAPKVQAAWKFVRDLMGKWQHEPWLCSKGHVGEPIWDPDASTNYLKARCGSCDTSSRKFRLGMRVSTDFCVFCKREGICHCAAERHRITNFLIKRMVFYYHENERLASRAAEMDSAIRCGKYYYWETWEDVKEAIGVEPSDGEEEEDGASVVSETQAVEDEDKEAEKKSPGRDGPTVAENKT
ncbi:hypothetical protein PG993_014194 [Apiospora rasikravindrae]|uniref:RING-type domain-containing protein n=1 Tax=Apiospora rasikravindrae TaxID=990691 RepID=A0ABR1RUD9_9PEZI